MAKFLNRADIPNIEHFMFFGIFEDRRRHLCEVRKDKIGCHGVYRVSDGDQCFQNLIAWERIAGENCRLSLEMWVRERLDNCFRIAALKEEGPDRDSWIEDAIYFNKILRRLDSPASGSDGT